MKKFCKQTAVRIPAARLPLSNADFGVGMILGRKSEKCQSKKNLFCKQTAVRIPAARLPLGNAAFVLEFYQVKCLRLWNSKNGVGVKNVSEFNMSENMFLERELMTYGSTNSDKKVTIFFISTVMVIGQKRETTLLVNSRNSPTVLAMTE